MSTDDALKTHEEAARLHDDTLAMLAQVAGRRVRVLRAVVYEGPAEDVLRTLARSLPLGVKEMGSVGASFTITVSQGAIEVLPEETPEPVE